MGLEDRQRQCRVCSGVEHAEIFTPDGGGDVVAALSRSFADRRLEELPRLSRSARSGPDLPFE